MLVEGIPLVSWPLHLARIALLVFGVPDGDHVLGADCQVQKGPGFGGAAVNLTSLSIRSGGTYLHIHLGQPLLLLNFDSIEQPQHLRLILRNTEPAQSNHSAGRVTERFRIRLRSLPIPSEYPLLPVALSRDRRKD